MWYSGDYDRAMYYNTKLTENYAFKNDAITVDRLED